MHCRWDASLISVFLLGNILLLMSRTSYGVCRCSVSAWMPRYSRRRQRNIVSVLLRGGSDSSSKRPSFRASSRVHEQSRISQSLPPPYTRTFSSTPWHATTTNSEAESTNYAAALCGDERSSQAASKFGGLKYFNTDIDRRFRVLFVLGGPGAGKGTQSALMVEHYPVSHFSVGELLRNVPAGSQHKETIEAALVRGQIVPVEISLALLRAAMEEAAVTNKHGLFLVDGFPRNYDNLSGWCRVMKDVTALESVLVYQCPLPVLQERILKRAQDSGRADDNLESVQKRFRTFEGDTVPVVEMLRAAANGGGPADRRRWSVVDIAGNRPWEEVWLSTQQVLNQLILHDVLTANAALLEAVQTGNVPAYEALCDPNLFTSKDVATVMQLQEGVNSTTTANVQRAQVDVISGRQVAVSYDRMMGGVWLREKRFWSHQGVAGWRNVHFARTPAESATEC